MLNRKSLIVATATALTLGAVAVPGQASAHDNGLLGAVIGAGVGAAIGHNVHGRDGALVGGAIGAIAGASIGAQSSYYDDGYYAAPPSAYAPAPEYYAAPATVYAPAPEYYTPPVYYGEEATYYQSAPVYYPRPQFRYTPHIDVRFDAHRGDRDRFVDHGRQEHRPDHRGDDRGHHH